MYLIFNQSKHDLLGHSKSSLQSHRPKGCRKRISHSIFYLNTELKQNVCHPTYTHGCFHHSGFPIQQVLMTSGDCDTVFEGLSLQALCWLCAHIYYRNISLLSHFCSQLHTNYLMDVQLCEHVIENHPLFLLLELKVLQLKSY